MRACAIVVLLLLSLVGAACGGSNEPNEVRPAATGDEAGRAPPAVPLPPLVPTTTSPEGSGTGTEEPARNDPPAVLPNPVEADDARYEPASCPRYKRLPLTTFNKNTLVEDDCLEIPDGTQITVGQDVHLIIVAKHKLAFGRDVVLTAQRQPGGRGSANSNVEDWGPSPPDQSEKIHCACRGSHCRDGWGGCSAAGKTHLMGGRGEPGKPGGQLDVVAREIVLPTSRSMRIEVSGGAGGPPGASGRVDCKRGGIQCSAMAGNHGAGPTGAAGSASYRTGTVSAATVLEALRAATTPSTAATTQIVDTNVSLRRAIEDAREAGRGYDNLSGIAP